MSSTKETKLLMESWRKFLNEEKDPKMEDLTSVFRSNGASDDTSVYYNIKDEDFKMIDKEDTAEVHMINNKGEFSGGYGRAYDVGEGKEEFLDVEETLIKTGEFELDADGQLEVYTIKELESSRDNMSDDLEKKIKLALAKQ